MLVFEYGPPPSLAAEKHQREHTEQNRRANGEGREHVVILAQGRVAPAVKVVTVLTEQHALLAERDQDLGGLGEEPRQGVELVAQVAQRLAPRRIGCRRERIAASGERLELRHGIRAYPREGVLQRRGAAIDRLDGADLLR